MKVVIRDLTEAERDKEELKYLREMYAKLQQDLVYLLHRASRAGWCSFVEDRAEGVSSNALVRWAYGGKAPTESEKPIDESDLAACRRAVDGLPDHRHMPWIDQLVERYARQLGEDGHGKDALDDSPMDTAERPA